MKKLVLTITFVVMAVITCNAQFYVGGNLGYSSSSSSTKTSYGSQSYESKNDGYSDLVFSPKVGFFINSKMSVGVSFSYNPYTDKRYSSKTVDQTEIDYKYKSWSVNPYLRYTVAQVGNLSIMAEVSAGIHGDNPTVKTGKISSDSAKISGYSFGLVPVVSYKLSNKFSLETYVNFLALTYKHSKTTITDDGNYYTTWSYVNGVYVPYLQKTLDTKSETSTDNFSCGVNGAQNLFNLGVIYTF